MQSKPAGLVHLVYLVCLVYLVYSICPRSFSLNPFSLLTWAVHKCRHSRSSRLSRANAPFLSEGGSTYFLLDRRGFCVHVVNELLIYPYKSWIYRVNETFSSSANSIEMAGPHSEPLPRNLAWRLA